MITGFQMLFMFSYCREFNIKMYGSCLINFNINTNLFGNTLTAGKLI